MVLDPLVPSSTENLNLFSIGFSAEFDFPCLYSNTCIVHLCSCRLFSYNVLPISFCSNAPPHFCATVIRSLCLHSKSGMEGEKYIAYTGIIGCQSLEQYIRKSPHGGGECEMSYTSSGAVIVSHQCLGVAWLSMDFCEGQEEPCVCPFST